MKALSPRQAALRHSLRLGVVVVCMFGFGFALGPLYALMCDITGWNGQWENKQAVVAAAPVQVDTSRKVKVLFVTTVNGGQGMEFRAEQTSVDVHPGELKTVGFYAKNTQGRAMVAQAVPNVAPWEAAKHLKKTECFCFNQQPFKMDEEKHMPVRFMLDPDISKNVDTVTLSYTFFEVTQKAALPAALNVVMPNS